MKSEFTAESPEVSKRLGAVIGKRLRGGEVLVLLSDLGGGKTTFTQGLAEGMGSKDLVTSPTFTISQVYQSETVTIFHFDFYRLGETGLISEELREALDNPSAVCVIEWPHTVLDLLPPERTVRVSFKKDENDENIRYVTLEFPEELSYLSPEKELEEPA